MNPHSSKSRRNQMNNAAAAAAVNAAAAAAVSMPAPIETPKPAPFQLSMDKQNNLIPRMNPSIKHELYFPQCYAPPFGNQFGAQQQAHSSSVGTTNNSSVIFFFCMATNNFHNSRDSHKWADGIFRLFKKGRKKLSIYFFTCKHFQQPHHIYINCQENIWFHLILSYFSRQVPNANTSTATSAAIQPPAVAQWHSTFAPQHMPW